MPIKLVRRHGGKIFYARGSFLGVALDRSTRCDQRRQAEAVVRRWQREIEDRVLHGRQPALGFAEAVVIYLESGGSDRFLERLVDHFGDTPCEEIDQAALNRAARALYPGAAPATVNRQLVTPVSAVLHAAPERRLPRPPRLRRLPEPQGRTRWLTPEEAERLFAALDARVIRARAEAARAVDLRPAAARAARARATLALAQAPRLRALTSLLLGAGLRSGEALALEAADLHLATCEAFVARSKTGRPRMVRFPARTRADLAAAGLPDAGPVFLTPRNRPYALRAAGGGQFAAAFARLAAEAGLGPEVTPHVLRHTWATWFYAATRDLRLLMDHGGWSKPNTAMRYTKLAPDDLAERLAASGWEMPGALARLAPPRRRPSGISAL